MKIWAHSMFSQLQKFLCKHTGSLVNALWKYRMAPDFHDPVIRYFFNILELIYTLISTPLWLPSVYITRWAPIFLPEVELESFFWRANHILDYTCSRSAGCPAIYIEFLYNKLFARILNAKIRHNIVTNTYLHTINRLARINWYPKLTNQVLVTEILN